MRPAGPYGLLAEFKDADALLAAATRAYGDGYRQIDAFTPFPVHGLAEAMGHTDKRVQWTVLVGGLVGMLAGFGLCYWTSVIDYPLNIGGRPLNSWPAFIVPTFETTILFAAISAVASVIVYNGLPQPYHPVFNVARFRERASQDGFFFAVEAADPKFDLAATRQYLHGLGAIEVNDVAH
ncbi:MAG: DUF3341 domain-containing protein [Vicinamibacteraceae bacterium]|nr:DUF3341 domain-containing protein [Vicinamibacteraceae bacterium]